MFASSVLRLARIALLLLAGGLLVSAEPPSAQARRWYGLAATEHGYTLQSLFTVRGTRIVAPPGLEALGCAEFPNSGARKSYAVFYGGQRAGSVSSAGPNDPVRVRGARLEKDEWALATDGPATESPSASARRAPTKDERTALLALGRKLFSAHGSGNSLLRRIRIEAASSTDVDRDGAQELIATLAIPETDDPAPVVRTLFLVTDTSASRTALARYAVGGGETYSMEYFLDHADLDGDGMQELVTRLVGWEGMEYRVYRKRDGRWRQVFSGGGCITG